MKIFIWALAATLALLLIAVCVEAIWIALSFDGDCDLSLMPFLGKHSKPCSFGTYMLTWLPFSLELTALTLWWVPIVAFVGFLGVGVVAALFERERRSAD